MDEEQQEQYLQFLVQECQQYIKQFQQLQSTLGISNDQQENYQTNGKLKQQKARLEKQLSNTCMQIQRQRKQVQEYERQFQRKRQELQQFDRQIHQKQAILNELNKQLKNQR